MTYFVAVNNYESIMQSIMAVWCSLYSLRITFFVLLQSCFDMLKKEMQSKHLFGFKMLQSLISSSDFNVGPHYNPKGFLIPLQNSTCAPSGCLVLSPIQT